MESFNSETAYNDLCAAAAKAGTNLTQLCKEAGIPRNTVQTWQKTPPKSFVLLGKLFAAIEAKTPKPQPAND